MSNAIVRLVVRWVRILRSSSMASAAA